MPYFHGEDANKTNSADAKSRTADLQRWVPQLGIKSTMKYNTLLSEFTMVFDQPSDLFGRDHPRFKENSSFLGLILRREDPDTQKMNLSFVADCLEEYVRRMIGACAYRVSIPAHGKGVTH